jgi:hypothetical protein
LMERMVAARSGNRRRRDNPPRKILYYCLNQSTLALKQ